MDIDPKDIKVSYYNPNERAGGWSLTSKSGVLITHKPSGIEARSDMERSAHANRAVAMVTLQRKVNGWEALGRPAPSGYSEQAPIPNPHNVNFAQMRKDMDNGVMLCRLNILQAIDYGAALQARHRPAVQIFDASALPDGLASKVISHAVESGVISEGRIASIDTNAKEQ